jgi:hypothetical protein
MIYQKMMMGSASNSTGKFVLFNKTSGRVATSLDGITWVSGDTPFTTAGKTIAGFSAGNGMYVAGSNASGAFTCYSMDGLNWTQCPTSYNMECCAYSKELGMWVSGTYYYSTQAAKSTDGINWTPTTNVQIQAVTAFNGKFVASYTGYGTGYTSIDGINWVNTWNMPSSGGEPSVANGICFTWTANNDNGWHNLWGYKSLDGTTFSYDANLPNNIFSMIYVNGAYFSGARFGWNSSNYKSTDGVNWTTLVVPAVFSKIFTNGVNLVGFVANGSVYYSTDWGNSWVSAGQPAGAGNGENYTVLYG